MSADNFVQVREFDDGWYWADFGASEHWNDEWEAIDAPKKLYTGPFADEEEAADAADKVCHIIEYGIVNYEEKPK